MLQVSRQIGVAIALFAVATVSSAQQLKDPTAPPEYRPAAVSNAEAVTNLRLQSIQSTAQGNVATINGTRVRAGDSLPPFTILKITMDQVTVRHTTTGGEMQLVMFSERPLESESSTGSGGQN
jgi:hypothetical protein